MPRFRLSAIRRGLLLFWALWLGVVTITNAADAMKALGVIPASFVFTSGNWDYIRKTMDPLGVPAGLQAFMFTGIIAWEGLAASAFAVAFSRFRDRALVDEPEAIAACAINLSLWAAFIILDEVFLAYGPEAAHRVIFAIMILTVLALHALSAGTDRGEQDGDQSRRHDPAPSGVRHAPGAGVLSRRSRLRGREPVVPRR